MFQSSLFIDDKAGSKIYVATSQTLIFQTLVFISKFDISTGESDLSKSEIFKIISLSYSHFIVQDFIQLV